MVVLSVWRNFSRTPLDPRHHLCPDRMRTYAIIYTRWDSTRGGGRQAIDSMRRGTCPSPSIMSRGHTCMAMRSEQCRRKMLRACPNEHNKPAIGTTLSLPQRDGTWHQTCSENVIGSAYHPSICHCLWKSHKVFRKCV